MRSAGQWRDDRMVQSYFRCETRLHNVRISILTCDRLYNEKNK